MQKNAHDGQNLPSSSTEDGFGAFDHDSILGFEDENSERMMNNYILLLYNLESHQNIHFYTRRQTG